MGLKGRIQKLAIRIFDLNDLSDLIKNERSDQAKIDEVYYSEVRTDALAKQARAFSVERSRNLFEIKRLSCIIDDMRKHEKEIDNKEVVVKVQQQAIIHATTRLYSEVDSFTKDVARKAARLDNILQDTLKLKKTIETGKTKGLINQEKFIEESFNQDDIMEAQ